MKPENLTTDDWELIRGAMAKYREVLREDLKTQYSGHEEYGIEDDMFLGNELSRTCAFLIRLEEAEQDTAFGGRTLEEARLETAQLQAQGQLCMIPDCHCDGTPHP